MATLALLALAPGHGRAQTLGAQTLGAQTLSAQTLSAETLPPGTPAQAGSTAVEPPIFQPAPPRATPAASPLLGTPLAPVVRLGQQLLAAGILPRLRLVQSYAANPSGGLKQGQDSSGVVIFGADANAERLFGWPGAQFHATFAQFWGHELATDAIGSRTKVQSFYYPRKQFELSELTYEQALFDKRLDIVVGRANATGEFARSTYGCRFQGVADCPFELTQAVAGFPGFPYVNWGGYVRINPVPHWYAKAGAFELNASRNTNSGFTFGLERSTGYVVPFEVGYGDESLGPGSPVHAKIGGWYNSAPYTDPFLNGRLRSRALFGGAPLAYSGGRRGAYALADAVLWRAGAGDRRNIAGFVTTGVPFDGDGLFSAQATAGLVWEGPLPGRGADQAGVQGTYLRLSNLEDGYINDLLRRNGSTSFVSRNQAIFEVNYNYRLEEGIYLAGSMQYLVNPDPIARPSARIAPKDALVLGLKLSVNANALLGLPLSARE